MNYNRFCKRGFVVGIAVIWPVTIYVSNLAQYKLVIIGAIHKLCNVEDGEGGSGQALSHRFSLIKVNQNFDRKCYMKGRGVKNGQFWRYIIYGQPLLAK